MSNLSPTQQRALEALKPRLRADGYAIHTSRVVGNRLHVFIFGADLSYEMRACSWARAESLDLVPHVIPANLSGYAQPASAFRDAADVMAKVYADGYQSTVAIGARGIVVGLPVYRSAYAATVLRPWASGTIPTAVTVLVGSTVLGGSDQTYLTAFASVRSASKVLMARSLEGGA